MKKYIFFFFMIVGFTQMAEAQVKIGGKTKADASSVLELESTDKGLLISRLTATQIAGIVNPATGLLVYNTELSALQINIGTPAAPQWATLVVSQGTGANGALVLPAGTVAERPTTPVAGTMRFNTESNKFEGYNGTAWVEL
jgi:hypothetical protein